MWTDTADGRRRYCDRHDQTFSKTSSCTSCKADPGIAPEDVAALLPAPPDGCLTSVDHERAFVAELDEVNGLLTSVMPDVDDASLRITDSHLINSISKLFEVRAKLRRAASELARAREDDELVAARAKAMKASQKGHAH